MMFWIWKDTRSLISFSTGFHLSNRGFKFFTVLLRAILRPIVLQMGKGVRTPEEEQYRRKSKVIIPITIILTEQQAGC